MSDFYTANGKEILRDGHHFADTNNPEVADALALVLNGQVMLGPDVSTEQQAEVARVLWGEPDHGA